MEESINNSWQNEFKISWTSSANSTLTMDSNNAEILQRLPLTMEATIAPAAGQIHLKSDHQKCVQNTSIALGKNDPNPLEVSTENKIGSFVTVT